MVVSRKKKPQQKTSNSVFEGFTDVTINGFFVGSCTVYFFARLQDITTKCLCLSVAKAFLYPMPMCKSDSTWQSQLSSENCRITFSPRKDLFVEW